MKVMVVKGGENHTYLGSKLSSDGDITAKVSFRVAKSLCCLRVPIFLNCTLSNNTKRTVFKALVISILLYVTGSAKTGYNCIFFELLVIKYL